MLRINRGVDHPFGKFLEIFQDPAKVDPTKVSAGGKLYRMGYAKSPLAGSAYISMPPTFHEGC